MHYFLAYSMVFPLEGRKGRNNTWSSRSKCRFPAPKRVRPESALRGAFAFIHRQYLADDTV